MAMPHTSLPSSESSKGATTTSPVGRFTHLSVFRSSIASVKKVPPFTLIVICMPDWLVTSTSTASPSFLIIFWANLRICSWSFVVTASAPSVNMSIVMPGHCTKRALRVSVSNFMSSIRKEVSSRMPRSKFMWMSAGCSQISTRFPAASFPCKCLLQTSA